MKIWNYSIKYKVLVFKLLDKATISANQLHMCLTLANYLAFHSIKTVLKIIFCDKTKTLKDISNQFQNLNFKQEESVFVVDRKTKFRRKVYPTDNERKIRRCVIWDSTMHWVKTCHYESSYNVNGAESETEDETVCNEEVNIILMTNEYQILIKEMETNATIDTICTKTVSSEFFKKILQNV